MYREILIPVDNSDHSGWALARALEVCAQSGGHITANHVYAARLHDVRFRQLETGLPAQFQTPQEIDRQRKIHDKLIEKGLQLISDSFLDQTERRCRDAGVPMTRQLLEGTNYEEISREANLGGGRLPTLIGFEAEEASRYDGGKTRSDLELNQDGRLQPTDGDEEQTLARSSGRSYDLLCLGAHGIGRQPASQLGGVVSRVLRKVEKDTLIVRDDKPLRGGRWIVCVDGSAYSYKAARIALDMARDFGAKVYFCSAFDVEFHHVVFGNIKGVLSKKAAKVFKFEEQEALHNTIIDKGLLKLCQANLKRAEEIHREFPEVETETQILIGKPFQCILQWIEELEPTLLVLARHGSHRIEGTELGSQAENLCRLANVNLLLVGTAGVRADDVPAIEEDEEAGLEWTPEAEIRVQRVPPFALGIARRAVEEFVLEKYAVAGTTNGQRPVVTGERLDEGIEKLLPTHMQLIMGIGTAEELAVAEVKAEEAMKRTVVEGHDADAEPETPTIMVTCPHSGHAYPRERTAADPVVWTHEAYERLVAVPLIARPLARNTVERFATDSGLWRVTTRVMDENKQTMIAADEFDTNTMLVMFRELQSKQIRAAAEGVTPLTPEMQKFIEASKTSGSGRCPLRDLVEADSFPVDFDAVSPADARAAVEHLLDVESPVGMPEEEDPVR